ncbi:preprotein translocase subunit YajC [Leptonema illini]|nr:preprotein translocase subunit YajC [Leptonema illini]
MAQTQPAKDTEPKKPIIMPQEMGDGQTSNHPYEKLLLSVIDSQEKTISQMALFFNGLAILLGLASIIIPLIAYFFAIRPAQKAAKEIANIQDSVDALIEKKFAAYIEEHEYRRIESYLNDIQSGTFEMKKRACLYLSLNQHLVESESHINRIYEILSGEIDQDTRNSLSYIITNKNTVLCRHYFERVLRETLLENPIWYSFTFFLNFGFEKSAQETHSFLASIPEDEFRMTSIQINATLAQHSIESRLHFYNCCEIFIGLSAPKLEILAKHAIENTFKSNPESFKNTCLALHTAAPPPLP